jgi:predicted DNA-binding transcriptional regulator AlpA
MWPFWVDRYQKLASCKKVAFCGSTDLKSSLMLSADFKKGGEGMEHKLLNTTEAASYLGVSKAFLERDRWAGARIPFIKVGSRAVRYRLSILETYIQEQTRRSTSDPGGDRMSSGFGQTPSHYTEGDKR